MSSSEILDRLRFGDESAFEELFREHYEGLVAFATRYAGTAAAAEELVQDLFADLWEKRGRWEIRTSLRAYLYSAVRNRALNVRRRAIVERDWADDEAHTDRPALQWSPPRADDAIVAGESAAELQRALESLPVRCRLTMQLRWFDQLSYAEIAETLGISVKGVENQLSRGLKALRDRLL